MAVSSCRAGDRFQRVAASAAGGGMTAAKSPDELKKTDMGRLDSDQAAHAQDQSTLAIADLDLIRT